MLMVYVSCMCVVVYVRCMRLCDVVWGSGVVTRATASGPDGGAYVYYLIYRTCLCTWYPGVYADIIYHEYLWIYAPLCTRT